MQLNNYEKCKQFSLTNEMVCGNLKMKKLASENWTFCTLLKNRYYIHKTALNLKHFFILQPLFGDIRIQRNSNLCFFFK